MKEIVRNNSTPLTAGLIILIHVVGILGLLSPFREMLLSLTPMILIIDLVLLLAFHKVWNQETLMAIVLCAVGGFSIEVLGVHTGVVFGEYVYGPVLGLQLFEVPLIIGVNWVLLIYCTGTIARTVVDKTWQRIIVASALMVAIDLLIEPVAIKYNFWSWVNGSIPVQNFIAWFGFSALMLYLFYKLRINLNNKIAFVLYLVLAGFFGILNLV